MIIFVQRYISTFLCRKAPGAILRRVCTRSKASRAKRRTGIGPSRKSQSLAPKATPILTSSSLFSLTNRLRCAHACFSISRMHKSAEKHCFKAEQETVGRSARAVARLPSPSTSRRRNGPNGSKWISLSLSLYTVYSFIQADPGSKVQLNKSHVVDLPVGSKGQALSRDGAEGQTAKHSFSLNAGIQASEQKQARQIARECRPHGLEMLCTI